MQSASMDMSARAQSRAATPTKKLDEVVANLRERAREWARQTPAQRVALLEACVPRLVAVSRPWVSAACRAKGLEMDTPASGEEWLAGPVTTIRNVRLLARSIREIAQTGKPALDDARITTARDGVTKVEVFPTDKLDAALFTGFSCSVRMLPGVTPAQVREKQASFYAKRDPEGGVSLVLGAGNVASIPPMDALYKLFVEGSTCVVKMNPVNEYLGPFFEDAFKPLIEKGYLAIAYGGGDVGAHLCNHPAVTDVHITGSDRTHDLIVWGATAEERERRKAANDPLLKKPITSELGCVTPVVIAPARFTDGQLQFLAENVATMVANNGSFNCNAAKMIVTSKGWAQREEFLARLKSVLSGAALRKAYYPGARDRYDYLLEGKSDVVRIGTPNDEQLAWAIVPGLDASKHDERMFRTEAFCGVLGEVPLPEGDPTAFMAAATTFCNERLWGTLSCSVVVHPDLEKDPGTAAAVDDAIATLRYGGVGVNHWAGIIYGNVAAPWGAHPSSTLQDIQGGLGWVHNTYMLEGIEKAVLRGPLTVSPKPPWFVTHKKTHKIGEKLVAMEADPGWLKVPGIALLAMQG